MTQGSNIGIGIVGAGMVGQMCHLANFAANPACRVVAVADLRPQLAAAAAAKFGVPRVYRTHLELLADPDVNGVVVVTRRRATGPIVLDALNSGRHVLSEKPMAYTSLQAGTLVNAAQQRKRVYSIGYMKRHDAGVTRAMALLEQLRADGSLGAVVGARGWCFGGDTGGARDSFVMTAEPRPDGLMLWADSPDWLPAAARQGYDSFLNVYSHIINLARHALGASPVLLESRIATRSPTATIGFDGIPCSLEFSNQSAGPWQEGLAIAFERGSMTIALPPPFANGTEARVTVDDGRQQRELPRDRTWSFRRQADAFVSDIASGSRPLASGEDSLADIALAEAIWRGGG